MNDVDTKSLLTSNFLPAHFSQELILSHRNIQHISIQHCLAPQTNVFTCRELTAKLLPHLEWNEEAPPMLSFYAFAAVEKSAISCGNDNGMHLPPMVRIKNK